MLLTWKGTEPSAFSYSEEALFVLSQRLEGKGYFSGTLEALSLETVFAHIVAGVRSGSLSAQFPNAVRKVYFKEGQVVFASSTADHERLGEILVKLKLLSSWELQDAVAEVKPGVRLGQVLTRASKLSASSLYSAMTFLVREIVVALFSETSGNFLFLEGAPSVEDALKLPDKTKGLVLAGMQRCEQLNRWRRNIDIAQRVSRHPEVDLKRLSTESQRLLSTLKEETTLTELQQALGLTDYEFLEQISELLSQGILVFQEPATENPISLSVESTPPPSPLERYRSLIQTLCDLLTAEGHGLGDLRSFFTDPLPGMEKAFAGVTLSEAGEIDFNRIAENLSAEAGPSERLKTYEALDAFVSYALFSAKNLLTPQKAEVFQNRLRALSEERKE